MKVKGQSFPRGSFASYQIKIENSTSDFPIVTKKTKQNRYAVRKGRESVLSNILEGHLRRTSLLKSSLYTLKWRRGYLDIFRRLTLTWGVGRKKNNNDGEQFKTGLCILRFPYTIKFVMYEESSPLCCRRHGSTMSWVKDSNTSPILLIALQSRYSKWVHFLQYESSER